MRLILDQRRNNSPKEIERIMRWVRYNHHLDDHDRVKE